MNQNHQNLTQKEVFSYKYIIFYQVFPINYLRKSWIKVELKIDSLNNLFPEAHLLFLQDL